MRKLIDELSRLYLQAGSVDTATLQRQLAGQLSEGAVTLATAQGTRAIAIDFRRQKTGTDTQHWNCLCLVANALQTELGLPAPAVSISGADGYQLWLSLDTIVPVGQVDSFLALLQATYFPDVALRNEPAQLPPCFNVHTGKWAAFIHPDLGASFADESGLDMAPPFAGQAALLESLHSISEAQWLHAMQTLHPASTPVAAPATGHAGLLLQDATLEDIVRHLHQRNIEPTFRHLIKS